MKICFFILFFILSTEHILSLKQTPVIELKYYFYGYKQFLEKKISNKYTEPRSKMADIRAFGAVGDGITLNDTAFSAVMSASNDIFIPAGHWIITKSIKLKAGAVITIDANALIENISRAGDRESAIFAAGNFGAPEANALTYYNSGNVLPGTTVIKFPNISDATKFAIDDFIFVRGGNFYTSGGKLFYEYGSINSIKSVDASGGTIMLKFPVDESVSCLSVGNITQSDLISSVTGDNLFAIENVVVRGGNFKSAGNLFREGGGVLNCIFEMDNVEVDSVIYNNSWAHSRFSVQNAIFSRHLWELGNNSHHNNGYFRYARLTTSPVPGKRPLRTSEQSRFNHIVCDNLDLNAYTTSDVPIYIEGRGNEIIINHLLIKNAPLSVATFSAQAFRPNPPRVEDNQIAIHNCYAGSGNYYIVFTDTSGTSKRNKLYNSNFFGPVSSGIAILLDGDSPETKNVYAESGTLKIKHGTVNEKLSGNIISGQ